MDIPVYLFMGFLDAGKTTYLSNLMLKSRFTQGKRFLLIVCEEGECEYDQDALRKKQIEVRFVSSPAELTAQKLSALEKETGAQRVAVEYNAMWTLRPLAEALPENWYVFQSITVFDSLTFPVYNANMRSLVYEMLTSSSVVVYNRVAPGSDTSELHKAVRAVNRRGDIYYRYADGKVEQDTVEDPLPFDFSADVMAIGDRDYALWFADMYDDPEKYDGRTVRFLAWAERDEGDPDGLFMAGRHVLACCANDIQYAWLPCFYADTDSLRFPGWCVVTGVLDTADEKNGGVSVKVQSVTPSKEPSEPVVSVY
ncbi:MAG: hypothetical protein IJL69_03490 [Oscillospiraceae bacterium]|nr:hypothetical protein [Oscillospiraceae bacterium]